jgi:hypothetical protein
MNGADAVTKVRPVVASRASNGSMMNCKDHRIALFRREHFNARLPAFENRYVRLSHRFL